MEHGLIAAAQRDLARLRSPHKTQSSIAKMLGVDASTISRLEKGEIALGCEELCRYLSAIDSADARAYLEFLEKDWGDDPRPDFWHPSRCDLSHARQIRTRMEGFASTHELGPLAPVFAHLSNGLDDAARFLGDLSHRIVFMGNIGVGKSTALCVLNDLILPQASRSKKESQPNS